jgi:hypothetical protein
MAVECDGNCTDQRKISKLVKIFKAVQMNLGGDTCFGGLLLKPVQVRDNLDTQIWNNRKKDTDKVTSEAITIHNGTIALMMEAVRKSETSV